MRVKPWPHLHVYKSGHDGQWYWRLRAPNGRIIAVAGEGYRTKQGCTRGMRTVIADMAIAQSIYDAPPSTKLQKALYKIAATPATK